MLDDPLALTTNECQPSERTRDAVLCANLPSVASADEMEEAFRFAPTDVRLPMLFPSVRGRQGGALRSQDNSLLESSWPDRQADVLAAGAAMWSRQ